MEDILKAIKELHKQHQYIPFIMLRNYLHNPEGLEDNLNNLYKTKQITVHRGLNDKLIRLI